jgi:hypothetical protein
MYFFNLFDREDRLGANIINYIAQLLYAYHNRYIIRFTKEKESYRYFSDSIFVRTLFEYIEKHNEKLTKHTDHRFLYRGCDDGNDDGSDDQYEYKFENKGDIISTTTSVLHDIKSDFLTYFFKTVFKEYNDGILFKNKFPNKIPLKIPFDVDNTILVHLRLDDVAHRPDYDGSICSNYYKNKIRNQEECVLEMFGNGNHQAPLSREKLDRIIKKAQEEFRNYKVVFITSPSSDTSSYLEDDDEVIRSHDENLDLYFLTMCKVVILSRSTFALSSMFFNKSKVKTYIPLWGHFVCCGLDTVYDRTDRSKIEYFV